MAMGGTHQPSDFLCIARWFKTVPVYDREKYRDEVEDCLMSLSADSQAKREIGVLDRVLRYVPVLGVLGLMPALKPRAALANPCFYDISDDLPAVCPR
jgi:hypothetical protein